MSYSAQDGPHRKERSGRNISSAEAERPGRILFSLAAKGRNKMRLQNQRGSGNSSRLAA